MNTTTDTHIVAFLNESLGHTSYLVDLGDGTALVIDPARLPDEQRAEAERRGLRIRIRPTPTPMLRGPIRAGR